jgi:hypothetical protein
MGTATAQLKRPAFSRAGVSDPTRPDFPESGLSVFFKNKFLTHTAGVSLQYYLYQN